MTGLRERNKEKRRQAILDAALALLDEDPSPAVTVERIAALAEVAPATVYNLIGPRDEVLLGLVKRVLDDLIEEVAAAAEADPLDRAVLVVDRSARAFIAHSAAFRYVIGTLGNRPQHPTDERFDPATLQIAAMQDAQRQGVVRPDLDPVVLGRQIYLSYTGAMFAWTANTLSDEAFLAAARHGLFTVVAAAATDEHRAELDRRWQDTAVQLARTLPGAKRPRKRS